MQKTEKMFGQIEERKKERKKERKGKGKGKEIEIRTDNGLMLLVRSPDSQWVMWDSRVN
jgi:hypothetical protein